MLIFQIFMSNVFMSWELQKHSKKYYETYRITDDIQTRNSVHNSISLIIYSRIKKCLFATIDQGYCGTFRIELQSVHEECDRNFELFLLTSK